MLKKSKLIDSIGVIIESYLVKVVVIIFLVVFGFNHLLVDFTQIFSANFDVFLIDQYKVIFDQNIGTITTIAAVFIGIYFTVLSILGSLKLNSVLSVLGEAHLLKLIGYLKDAMAASFLLLFYSLFIPAINNQFWKSYLFFALFLYMVMTAIRFGINIIAIYEKDFSKLKGNIDEERSEKEKMTYIMEKLDIYLQEAQREKAYKNTVEIAKLLDKKKKDS